MLTLEEKIRQLEAIAESGDELYADYEEHGLQDTHGARRTKSLIEEKRQEIAWLRELQDRRKAPEIIFCHECRYWKDSDGVYRRGISAESKCPVNSRQVYEGTFFCGMAERRTDGQN